VDDLFEEGNYKDKSQHPKPSEDNAADYGIIKN
jgi:hypothetical protein